ncbi:MAG: hypothetical protein LC659_13635 [Myxococcales bacterium]|nr:hypothetical protein [Myxococcales bacterium]
MSVPNIMKPSACVDGETVRCIVATPRRSTAELKYDPEAKRFTLPKSLVAGLACSYDGASCRRRARQMATRSMWKRDGDE